MRCFAPADGCKLVEITRPQPRQHLPIAKGNQLMSQANTRHRSMLILTHAHTHTKKMVFIPFKSDKKPSSSAITSGGRAPPSHRQSGRRLLDTLTTAFSHLKPPGSHSHTLRILTTTGRFSSHKGKNKSLDNRAGGTMTAEEY